MVHLHITGRVQGVFYRKSAQDKAHELGITGWVRNKADGSVEAVAQGERVQEFIDWCWKGPSGASVTDVTVNQDNEPPHPDFSIR